MKIRQFKKTMDVIMILLIFIIATVGCAPNDSSIENNEDKLTIAHTVYTWYNPSNYHSFVKMRINSFYDGIYDLSFNSNTSGYLLLNCTVIEDYYKNIHDNLEINVMLPLPILKDEIGNVKNSNSEKNLSSFLCNYEYFFAYFRFDKTVSSLRRIYSYKTNNYVELYYTFDLGELRDYRFLPIKNNEIDIESLEIFLNDNYPNHLHYSNIISFEEIFLHIKEDEIIRNIKNIYTNCYETED